MTRLAGRAGNWAARRRALRGVLGAQAGVGALGWRAWGARLACVARGKQGARQAGRARGRQVRGSSAQATGGRSAGRHGVGARLGARSARGTAGLGVAWVLDGCTGWASFGALCTWLSSGSVFGPGSTRYFPESPNEHCSL